MDLGFIVESKLESMKPFAKLIHKTYASYLPTAFPAHYYGMPNGKIYLVFSRFYKSTFGKTDVEFVFAEHKDFYFDYDKEEVVTCTKQEICTVFAENVDQPRAQIDVLSINRDFNSYGEAQVFINHEAQKMAMPA